MVCSLKVLPRRLNHTPKQGDIVRSMATTAKAAARTTGKPVPGKTGQSSQRGRPPAASTNDREPGAHSDREQSTAMGKEARKLAPLESHSHFTPAASRDPIGLLIEQAESRVTELVPVRNGRMLVSPFAYYRGSALPMAADLAESASSGLRVQLCGDAHLSNFGAFASPERRVVFDLNDFDETLPGPFEWDVKRLLASMAVAGRDNALTTEQRRKVALATAGAYRTAMQDFARLSILNVWYAHFDVEDALAKLKSQLPKKAVRQTKAGLAKARTRDSTQAVAKLTRIVDGRRRIISQPPLIVPIEDAADDIDVDSAYKFIRNLVSGYTQTLLADRRQLVGRFTLTGMARKVVGVGSVGTEAWVLLCEPDDGLEPLLLQAKEAQRSVLADYAGESDYDNHGERVVTGQRLMQAVGDIFLGWQRVAPPDRRPTDYYLRQLRDWKYSVDVGAMNAATMALYGRMCGWTLARAHARTGDRIAIAGYLGESAAFDQAVADFAETYADQTERDYASLGDAVSSGRVPAQPGV
jgi:uncharacterized protein (DUF2252 family)